jgi:hypothetical protein
MPRNPSVIAVQEALQANLIAKPVAVTPVAATDCPMCNQRRATQRTKMQRYRSKTNARP